MSIVKTQVDEYLANCLLAGQSTETVDNAKLLLYKLIKFCKNNKIATLADFKTQHLTMFLSEQKVSKNTLKIYQAKLQSLFKRLEELEVVTNIKWLKIITEKKTKKCLTISQANMIRNALQKQEHKDIFDLIMETGLRVSEAIHLHKEDINWSSGSILVKETKGNADRTVFASEELLARLFNPSDKNPYLFHQKNGKLFGRKNIYSNIAKTARTLGIKATVHMLRHSYATEFLKKIKDTRALQMTLGHKQITTTELYMHLNPADIREKMLEYQKSIKETAYVSTDKL